MVFWESHNEVKDLPQLFVGLSKLVPYKKAKAYITQPPFHQNTGMKKKARKRHITRIGTEDTCKTSIKQQTGVLLLSSHCY